METNVGSLLTTVFTSAGHLSVTPDRFGVLNLLSDWGPTDLVSSSEWS